ncbi:NAD-dependent epimerase/dehydratase family protein [Chloroflexota bacterium]
MNILVTGGSGFIGSHVVDKLIEAGHKVRVLDIRKPHHREDLEFYEGNITSQKAVKESLLGMDIVYHIAAFSNINLVKANPLLTIKYNIMGTACLLEECRKRGLKRFVLASSIYVSSRRGHLYTTAKFASERICQDYYTLYSLPYTILRYGTAYGPRSRMVDVVSTFVAKALRGKNLLIYGSGEQKRNFIYVEDLALGTVAALKLAAENQTYILAPERAVSIRELAETVRSIFGEKISIEYHPAREDDYQGEIISAARAKKEFGLEPKVSLEEGIKKYIEWYQALERKETK